MPIFRIILLRKFLHFTSNKKRGSSHRLFEGHNSLFLRKRPEWVTTDADGQRISSGGSRKSSRTRELAHETAESGVSDTEDEREGTKMEILVGDVAGRVAILIDDMIDTGRTLALAAKTLKDAGASEVYAIIAHGLLSGRATDLIRRLELEKLVVSTLCAFFCARENGC